MASAERIQGANQTNAGQLSPYWGEHAARYVFALPYVENKSVLDIACGTGYGVAILGKSAKRVVGVDVDIDAARDAAAQCPDNTAVLLGDGLRLPFADESFDIVTSFETLEHLYDRGRFLSELNRVLTKQGLLVLSTPNAHYTKPVDGKPSNPFHVFEYTPNELRSELEGNYWVDKLLGQTLDDSVEIPPFVDAQKRLPKEAGIQGKLFAWKVLNKMPLGIRETVSNAIWRKPFYPTEADYRFSEEKVNIAPVLVAVCSKK